MSSSTNKLPVAIVTGSNKGIGYHIAKGLGAKGFLVIVTSTLESRAQTACEQLQKENIKCNYHCLDVGSSQSISEFVEWFHKQYGTCQVLVNNAGIMLQDEFSAEAAKHVLAVNYFGPKELTSKLHIQPQGRIIYVASGLGVVTGKWTGSLEHEMCDTIKLTETRIDDIARTFAASIQDDSYAQKGFPKTMYGVSKACLIALSMVQARTASQTVVSFCPGFCKTDLTGGRGYRGPEEGAETGIWLATDADPQQIKGGFYRDKAPLKF